jgi:hypothetical protein
LNPVTRHLVRSFGDLWRGLFLQLIVATVMRADQERLDRIQRALTAQSLDAFVFFHTDNILMGTGMLPGSTHVVAIVTADLNTVVITPWWRERFVQE